ncbi:MAG: hypothetical protein PUH67_05235 [bacterium]|nr:hypothetical protein [bacterium]MDY4979713.1 hypothetical protein [Candidatus Onthovivens sp.]
MKKRYLKNRYQIICFILGMSLLLPLCPFAMFLGHFEVALLTFISYISIVALYLLLGFSYVFQFVSFDEKGIHVYLFKKEIKSYEWKNVTEIKKSNIYCGPVYAILFNNDSVLYLDRRKKIKEEICKYYSKMLSIN